MTEKYRVIRVGMDYYPQVKLGAFGRWKRIARHPGGSFGLYDQLEYPKTRGDAISIVSDYKKWLSRDSEINLTIKM